MKKLLLFIFAAALIIWAVIHFGFSTDEDQGPPSFVVVERGSISVDAVAVGRVEAEFEAPVKSQSGGVLTQRFVELGQKVKKGDPLCEVRPVLTDLQRLRAERSLLSAKEAEQGAAEIDNNETIAGLAMNFFQGDNSVDRMRRGAERARSDAEAQLELLLNGSSEIDGKVIDYIIRAPIDGTVIALDLEVGEPVVPSSSYGSGTELVVLADLDHPVFRGTVDEIDVGRLLEGMAAELTLGARPEEVLAGKLTEISLQAVLRNNAVVFDVEIAVQTPADLIMRSGYSAVARIKVEEVKDALVLPERLVDFRDGKAFILQDDGQDGSKEVQVQTGLSDGLKIEIQSGLVEGEQVLERRF